MHLADDTVNTEATVWREDVTDSKHVVFAFRVFTQLLAEPQTRQTIGELWAPSRTPLGAPSGSHKPFGSVFLVETH